MSAVITKINIMCNLKMIYFVNHTQIDGTIRPVHTVVVVIKREDLGAGLDQMRAVNRRPRSHLSVAEFISSAIITTMTMSAQIANVTKL